MDRPLVLVDVDGVISLFGFNRGQEPDGRFVIVDGIPHFLSAAAGELLRELASEFDGRCYEWAAARAAPTLLVPTDPAVGLTADHVATLRAWAARSASPS
jgi:hypothetical protein